MACTYTLTLLCEARHEALLEKVHLLLAQPKVGVLLKVGQGVSMREGAGHDVPLQGAGWGLRGDAAAFRPSAGGQVL